MKRFQCVLVLGFCLLTAVPGWSHHAFSSEFDDSKTVTFSGVITKIEWINPHAYFYVESKDGGKTTNWSIQSFPPAALRRAGLTRDMLKPGTQVKVLAYAAKDGTKTLGWAHKLEFADGRVINIAREPETAKK